MQTALAGGYAGTLDAPPDPRPPLALVPSPPRDSRARRSGHVPPWEALGMERAEWLEYDRAEERLEQTPIPDVGPWNLADRVESDRNVWRG